MPDASTRHAVIKPDAPATGRDRVLLLLKTKGQQTAAQMAKRLGITTMAVRQHLAALQDEGLVDYVDEPRKVGRPARGWRLTPKAGERFGDHHVELAVGMLQAVHGAFGEKGLERVIAERLRQQIASYRARMPGPSAPLEQRVAALVRIRREEGYMAEWRRARDGSLQLVENHCAVERAARFCPKLCGAEVSLFRAVLGDEVAVDRSEYMLDGARRCAYRIARR